MPVEVFGSRRQGGTTSICNLLGRSVDNGAPSQHPLLTEPSSSLHPSPFRQSGDIILSDRNLENASSRLDTIFRSLRSGGRHGHHFNVAPVIPQGLEELLVSQLRRPTPEKPSENTAWKPKLKGRELRTTRNRSNGRATC
ncbi:hypothetical protein MKX03_030965 [Papaver bracteatum]|nr:hypothetical protein MKX03_030965 [Papaver bracteatum]